MILSIIGTRPQYIKVKPIFDYCRENGIEHQIIDSGQHYSKTMSEDIIADLNLEIDCVFNNESTNENHFMSNAFVYFHSWIKATNPKVVLIYGDTNTAMVAALVCRNIGVPFAHIEAGARTQNQTREEFNRRAIDHLASYLFCSSLSHTSNLVSDIDESYKMKRMGLSGDLEYELLNNLESEGVIHPMKPNDNVIMTLHRPHNMSKERLEVIMDFVRSIPYEVHLFSHHRLIQTKEWNQVKRPNNLVVGPAVPFTIMAQKLMDCKFVLTDSGSIPKTMPFFGKRAISLNQDVGWVEAIGEDYIKANPAHDRMDAEWACQPIKRDRKFYYPATGESPSKFIVNGLDI